MKFLAKLQFFSVSDRILSLFFKAVFFNLSAFWVVRAAIGGAMNGENFLK